MNTQQNIGKYLIHSFETAAHREVSNNNPIKFHAPANSDLGGASDVSIFRTTDK